VIAVKLSEFITLCGILRGSIYIDGILLSFLFCFDYAVFPATSIFFVTTCVFTVPCVVQWVGVQRLEPCFTLVFNFLFSDSIVPQF
jgi:hypothetical protein